MGLGPIMMDIEGLIVSQEDETLLKNPLVGGLILFARNYESPQQLQQLTYDIRNARKDPILIAVDQEGGRVQRFQDGLTRLPEFAKYGELYDSDPQFAIEIAKQGGFLMASEMLALGVDLSFSPVVDLNWGVSDIIGNRSFHRDPDAVTSLAAAYIKGMNQAGMQAVIKHFPGHGAVVADSHKALPIDERDTDIILKNDIIPFIQLVKLAKGVMTAHVQYENLDDVPATFSDFWLKRILRKQAQFKGAVFSDDLTMEGAACMGDYVQRSEKALHAGCDMILLCNNRVALNQVLQGLEGYENPKASQRLMKMCGHFTNTLDELRMSMTWHAAQDEISRLIEEV